ncbi:DoxX family protein [Variovorax fucosicus]|uniref:DoxX family protein n=1 Tax=Variovorax fucosicus TaxID=3053517 RepID=UPI0025790F82|nr:DoxX family protein [Variovorax sp. J22G47]MDM0056401.1 DoxX family protein [Variovorax sp. J22G47]
MPRKYTYWISTAFLSLLYLASATLYATQADTIRQALASLGYPGYIVPVLMVAKVLGVVAILSRVNVALSNLAYAGMFYHLLLSFSAHVNVGDGAGSVPAVIGLGLLIASFLTQNSARAKQSLYPPIAVG